MSAGALSSRYRSAFVTGASTGLGLAFTEMLLAEGVEVWGTARDAARLAPRPGFHPVTLDLTDGPAAEQVFLAADRAAGGFDLVINNAGFGAFGSFAHTDFAVWEHQFQVMLVNTARLSHAALRGLRARRRGALVNISSIAGEFGMPYQAVYNAVKAGLSALNESLMQEVKDTGVAVIDFRPGDYRTDFEGSVRRPEQSGLEARDAGRMARAWAAFEAMMRTGPAPAHAAASLRRALLRGRSGTVRTGRFFQADLGPFLARFAPLGLKRWILEKYFGL
ncbi:3-oxoacyl-[acyl-carrier-protein] reductase FabG [Lacunisphaera limnophila]|uniref:3-oxoacyl-[acyl-carrier-protein] reductase FabG n=1 Tax=Lacunisphaera limnophila TaxID=1838286 RepID=A0A1D8AVJ6_9BACT|nr:SDR family NAD(P)-dependent oxidoreductase [Lacunisphaera limnophila]AOS44919.1 3-oxoacyl-[acyl-carrier-protein] reductase FabG [Lacunisphaera limnophila]